MQISLPPQTIVVSRRHAWTILVWCGVILPIIYFMSMLYAPICIHKQPIVNVSTTCYLLKLYRFNNNLLWHFFINRSPYSGFHVPTNIGLIEFLRNKSESFADRDALVNIQIHSIFSVFPSSEKTLCTYKSNNNTYNSNKPFQLL